MSSKRGRIHIKSKFYLKQISATYIFLVNFYHLCEIKLNKEYINVNKLNIQLNSPLPTQKL